MKNQSKICNNIKFKKSIDKKVEKWYYEKEQKTITNEGVKNMKRPQTLGAVYIYIYISKL